MKDDILFPIKNIYELAESLANLSDDGFEFLQSCMQRDYGLILEKKYIREQSMETYLQEGVYGEELVYRLKSLADWDEYEKVLKEKDPDFIKKYDPNFYSFKADFEKYFGKIWVDKNTGLEYKVAAIEDDYANMDWYWVVQNVKDELDIKYILANSYDLEEGLS